MAEYAPDQNFKHPVCRGSWALGNNCKVCERCQATHPGRAGTQLLTNPQPTDTSRSGDLVDDDFAPIWDESILLAEHEAVQASVAVGGWLSAALDDPNVCDAMKADINRWFSAGFLYLDEVRKLMQTDRIETLEAERDRLREALRDMPEPHEYLGPVDLRVIRSYIDAKRTWRHKHRAALEASDD